MNCYLQPTWPAPVNVKAYTTLRHAWGNDDHKTPIARQALTSILGLPAEPVWLNQTHSNSVIEAKPENIGCEADASFTSHPNRICIIMTADCLPILLTNQRGTEVAAIHAGWRGLANGIVENTLQSLKSLPSQLLAWLGPAIGPEKFEVGHDVYQAFTTNCPASHVAFTPHTTDKWFADLYTLAKIRLQQLGIQQIYGGQYCTYTQADLFYSYRRDKSPFGRMASVIWLSP